MGAISVSYTHLDVYKRQVQARSNTMAGANIPYAWMYLSLPVTGVLYIFALITQWTRRID